MKKDEEDEEGEGDEEAISCSEWLGNFMDGQFRRKEEILSKSLGGKNITKVQKT